MLGGEVIGGERAYRPALWHEKRVLIVEDDPTLARFWAILLSEIHLKDARVVQTGGSAVNYLRWHGADLVIADLCLADLSGIELIKQAHQMNPLTKTVLTSSSLDISLPLDPDGFVHFLKKPYSSLADLKKWLYFILSESPDIEEMERKNPGVYVWDV